MNADELVSAILDDGREVAIDAESRELVVQRLFIHGLLAARVATKAIPRRRVWPRVASLAATVLVVTSLFLLMVQGDALPKAEAVMERVNASMAQPVDRHYVAQVVENGRVLRTNDWYCRGTVWTMQVETRLGEMWFGGDGKAVWWVGLRGVVRRFDDPAAFREAAKSIDPSLPYGNIARSLQDLASYQLTTVGREGALVRVHAVRREESRPLRQAELWADERSGVLERAELRFDFDGDSKVHVFTRVDAPRRDDSFYRPEGHSR